MSSRWPGVEVCCFLGYAAAMSRTQTIVPILGMHRSGTSLVTRALNIMGLDLGWPLQPAGHDNPKGFWEHLWFQRTNMDLLAAVGANPNGWGTQSQLKGAANQLAHLKVTEDWRGLALTRITREVQGHRGGIKDPRLVLTWGFWRRFFEHHGWEDLRPVVVVRHPAATLKSILSRGDLGAIAAGVGLSPSNLLLQIWTSYYSVIFGSLGGRSPVILTQEDLLDSKSAPFDLERLCRATDGDESKIEEALAWVDPSMDHRASSIQVPSDIEALYDKLAGMAKSQRVQWISNRKQTVAVPRKEEATPAWKVRVLGSVEVPLEAMFSRIQRIVSAGAFSVEPPFDLDSTKAIWLVSSLSVWNGAKIAQDSILVNLSPVDPGTPDFDPRYIAWLKGFVVMDLSRRNVQTLKRLGVNAHHLRVAFSQETPSKRSSSPDIDVLIYGRHCDRRESVVRQLTDRGLVVESVTNLFGDDLDERICRSKVVLSVHRDPWRATSLVRVQRPLHLGVAVVAERSLDPQGDLEVEGLVELCWYDELAQKCIEIVTSEVERAVRRPVDEVSR